MKGRKPIPTKLKVLMGNPGKQKLPKGEPETPEGMPEMPVFLDGYAKEEWDRLAPGLHAMGVLSVLDSSTFGAYCAAYSMWRTTEEMIQQNIEKSGPESGLVDDENINLLRKISRQCASDMVRFAAEFGLSPSSRARLAIEPGRRKSKFDGLIGH